MARNAAIKAGQIVHTGDTVMVDRLQTAGPGTLNIPTARINELGNHQAVAVIRDTPDLSFTGESLDVTTEIEQILTKDVGGSGPFHLAQCLPLDIASEWTEDVSGGDPYAVQTSVAIPQLAVESIGYRFGLHDNGTKSFTLRGDSIFYNPGPTFVEQFAGDNTANQDIVLAHNAGAYNGDVIAGARRALNVSVDGQRLIYGVDYTEAVTGSGAYRATTITIINAVPSTSTIQVVYFSNAALSYAQASHPTASVKPAAIRGKDITLLVGGIELTDKWTGVQSYQTDVRFQIQRDEEFGNPQAVAVDYADVPAVTGQVVIRPRSPMELLTRLQQITGVGADEAIGPLSAEPQRIDAVIHHPDTGAVLEVIEIPDARLSLPGYSGRVQTKLDMTLAFESDSGTCDVYASMPSS